MALCNLWNTRINLCAFPLHFSYFKHENCKHFNLYFLPDTTGVKSQRRRFFGWVPINVFVFCHVLILTLVQAFWTPCGKSVSYVTMWDFIETKTSKMRAVQSLSAINKFSVSNKNIYKLLPLEISTHDF